MNKQKLIHELFVGKVSDELGFDKTLELLKEAKEVFKDFEEEDESFRKAQIITT